MQIKRKIYCRCREVVHDPFEDLCANFIGRSSKAPTTMLLRVFEMWSQDSRKYGMTCAAFPLGSIHGKALEI